MSWYQEHIGEDMSESFDISKLEIQKVDEFEGEWKMAKLPIRGTVLVFRVIDKNLAKDNTWVFYAQVPEKDSDNDYVIVRPQTSPGREDLQQLERRAITFQPASVGKTDQRYCKINLSDPTGEKTKIGVRYGELNQLPTWFGAFGQKLQRKEAVKPTRGTDGGALAMLVDSRDYPTMIHVFFASRVWPLMAGFTLPR